VLGSWFVTADELGDCRTLPSRSLQMEVGQVKRQHLPSHPNTRNDPLSDHNNLDPDFQMGGERQTHVLQLLGNQKEFLLWTI
jgi:hypothetical protein